jgi:hypothetical protein
VEIVFWTDANEDLIRLEMAGDESLVRTVKRTLALLEADPADPRLRTKNYTGKPRTRITPCGASNFVIVWHLDDTDSPPWIVVTAIKSLQ